MTPARSSAPAASAAQRKLVSRLEDTTTVPQSVLERVAEFEKHGYEVPTPELIKTPAQIEKIRASAKINTGVLDAVAAVIHEGMSSWTAGSGYTFTKNPDYFKADEVKTDEIDFQFIQDTQSAMLAYQSGTIDVVKLTGEMVDQYKDSEGFTNKMTGYLWYLSLDFDTTNYPTNSDFSNLNLRKAMSYAIDRETICSSVLKDGSVAAEGIIPQQLATGPDSKDYRESTGKLVSYDAAKAKEYYEKAKAELGHGQVYFRPHRCSASWIYRRNRNDR